MSESLCKKVHEKVSVRGVERVRVHVKGPIEGFMKETVSERLCLFVHEYDFLQFFLKKINHKCIHSLTLFILRLIRLEYLKIRLCNESGIYQSCIIVKDISADPIYFSSIAPD